MGTWDEVEMLTGAGYKWDPKDPPRLFFPEQSVKVVDEDLAEKVANLNMSGEKAEKVEKISGNDEEEGSDKE